MNGITPVEIVLANVLINGAYGILPAIAIVVVGILILRRMPPKREGRAVRDSAPAGERRESADSGKVLY